MMNCNPSKDVKDLLEGSAKKSKRMNLEKGDSLELQPGDVDSLQQLPEPWPRLVRLCFDKKNPLKLEDDKARVNVLNALLDLDAELLDQAVDSSNGATALWFACNAGSLECAKFLVKEGANVNFGQAGGVSCLMQACLSGNRELVELLIQKGAHVHLKSELRKTCLDFVKAGEDELVKFVQKKLISVNKVETSGALEVQAFLDAFGGSMDSLDDDKRNAYNDPNMVYGKTATANRAHQDATNALKAMTKEQLEAQGEEYKQLIEAREMADVLGMS